MKEELTNIDLIGTDLAIGVAKIIVEKLKNLCIKTNATVL